MDALQNRLLVKMSSSVGEEMYLSHIHLLMIMQNCQLIKTFENEYELPIRRQYEYD